MRVFLSSLLVCAALVALALATGARAQIGRPNPYARFPPHSAMRFEVGAPAATASMPITTTTAGAAIVLPIEQPTTAAQRDAFVGSYKTAAPCTPSATCCCALDTITITPGTTANTLNLAGPSDGGAGCMGQQTLSGAFTLSDPLSAYAYLNFVPVLIQLQTENTHEWLQLNSTRTTCNNVFRNERFISGNPLQQVGNSIGGALANPTPEGLTTAISSAASQLPTAAGQLPAASQLPAVGSAAAPQVAASQAPAVTGAVVQPDGSLQLPATTLGTGSSALNLPSTTLPAPFAAASATGQQQNPMPAFPQVAAQQQQQQQTAALPAATGQVGGAGAAAATSTPVLPANPFANTQSAMPSSAQMPNLGAGQLPNLGAGQLPNMGAGQLPGLGAVGSSPFQINSLQAVPVPVLPGATASDASAAASQQPQIGQMPQVGGQIGQLPQVSGQIGQMPQVGGQIGQLPQVGGQIGQMPQVGAVGASPMGNNGPLGALPGSTGQVGAASNTPIGAATTPAASTPAATLPGSSALPGGGANPFSAAASNSTMAGVTFTPLLIEMSDSGAAAGTKNYLAAFIAPASADLGVVILHYYTMDDMRQKNVYMNRTQNSELAAQLTAAAGPALAPGQAYALYAHGPISVAADDQLTYSYTFAKLADGAGAANSPAYAYPSAAQPAGSVRAVRVPAAAITELGLPVTTGGGGEPVDPAAIDAQSNWNGAFQVDAQCVPSDSCCCGVGLLNVSSTVGRPGEVLLSGNLDGGAGCLYQTSLTGIMAVNASNPNQASRSIEIPNNEKTVITFVAQLDPAAGAASSSDLSQLTIFNTFRTCRTTATKVAPIEPAAATDDSTDPTSTELFPNSTSSANSTELPRDAFVGDYAFDDSCVPSASCCCATGNLNIAPVYEWTAIPPLPAGIGGSAAPTAANRSELVILNANLDGGTACVGMQNVSQAFSLTGPTAASFSMPPVTLNASLAQSQPGAGLDQLTFSNSLYPGCLSRAVKKSNIKNESASTHNETDPKDPEPHVEPTAPLLTAEQFTALRDSLVGEYEPSGCVPSADCCCAVGRTKVTANETSPMLMNVDTKLKGEGFSCLQKDGDIHMTFTLLNATAAEAQPFGAVNVKFMAEMHNDTSNKFVVSNTVHPACPTTMVKVALDRAGAAPRSHSAPMLVALVAVAVAALMRRS